MKKSCSGQILPPNLVVQGFSLVEMLMALLVASLLLAALAPVMTRRMDEKVNFEGVVPNPTRKKIVYLTEPGEGEWIVPNGIRSYKVTTVGAGGGGGAGSNYGCVVFTTTATPTGSLLGDDAKYCEHVRTDNSANFTIPEGINEIYVSMVSGAGGGGAGSATYKSDIYFKTAGTYNWNVPDYLRGDRIIVVMSGAGGGGGGADQGGGGGGAAGAMSGGAYNIAQNRTSVPVVVGAGGKGGNYWNKPGKGGAGWRNGGDGIASTGGGGGGGSTSFDNGAITAYGGGGGAGQCITTSGWAHYISLGGAKDLWKTCFNYGGDGRNGGTCGPCTYNGVTYGGPSGGIGGEGSSDSTGGRPGANGNVGDNGKAFESARGGAGGRGGSGTGKGGYGQDSPHGNLTSSDTNIGGGGAGGGGGGGGWGNGTSAPTGCTGPWGNQKDLGAGRIPKAEVGAGGAGASCGWNTGGTQTGGEGGDGRVNIRYLVHLYGGTGGQAGKVVPRSRIPLTNTMKSGSTITVTLGKGGKGGDRIVLHEASTDTGVKLRTMDKNGIINTSDDTLANAAGQPGSATTIVFNGTTIATTGGGSCGGGYQTTASATKTNCTGTASCGTHNINGQCLSRVLGWHGHQSGACASSIVGNFSGTTTNGGHGTFVEWNGKASCGPEGGTLVVGDFSKRNGADGFAGLGGSGSYYGGYGGKGGDGYVKIEWGIPRNLDLSDAIRYSGGGGSAGETVTKKITVSAVTNKIKYKIGEGGAGGSYNSGNNTMQDGSDGGDTLFGINGNYGFDTVKSKGGKGGKSVHITSAYDSNFIITDLISAQGSGGIAQCFTGSNCTEIMNGKEGENNKGGSGGTSSTGIGGNGGAGSNINGFDALEFDGARGGGAGGGGGISANNNYGKGGRGANGYIKIEYDD